MSPRPGPERRPLNVRISDGGHEAIAERAAAEGVKVSEMARRMLKYAVLHMPKGWNR